jgi:hypothetical protein
MQEWWASGRVDNAVPGQPGPKTRHHRVASMRSLSRAVLAAVLLAGCKAMAQAQGTPAPALPSFAELEAAGARIGEIRIAAQDIFDTSNPKEDKLLFRWANALHISTRPHVIERALLFKSGDLLSVRVIEESERVLRTNRFLYDVQFRPLAVHDGVVDIEVLTRDTWTLDVGGSASRTGGTNSSGVHLNEYNVLGTGTAVSFGHSKSVDRSSNEFQFANDRAFGTQAAVKFSHATNSDGRRVAASVIRPFISLDARRSGGVSFSDDNRIDAVYNAGNVVSQYRHRQQLGEAFGGWSQGLVDGWVQRYSIGLSWRREAFGVEPGLAAPSPLPGDETLVTPFVRYNLIEDRFERQENRNLIGRPEFFALGLNATVQLGWAAKALGSTANAFVYSGSISRGFEPARGQTLTVAAMIDGRSLGDAARRQQIGAQIQYYLPQSRRWLFYASAAGDMLTRPDPADTLQLGGDNGLRGYPLRYQSGTRRALFTVEERFYTGAYVWQLFRVGGAAFFDTGRAWGGANANTLDPGWLRNAGFGLRIVSARSAFSNVLHVDLAFPLGAPADIKKMQFLVKTKASF